MQEISDLIAGAQHDLEQKSARMLHLFSFVPDNKQNWSPAPTSRSAVQIVAHCAVVCAMVAKTLTGTVPEVAPSAEDFFRVQGEVEKEMVAHDDVAARFREATVQLGEAMSTLTASTIDSVRDTPFGPLPLRFWLSVGQEQLAGHTGQLEYLQTIWGDMDNHLG